MNDQFLFFNGILCYFCFIANLIDIGIGSNEGLIISGPMTLLGFIFVGFVTTFCIELDRLTGYRRLFVLFCRYRSTLWACWRCLGM